MSFCFVFFRFAVLIWVSFSLFSAGLLNHCNVFTCGQKPSFGFTKVLDAIIYDLFLPGIMFFLLLFIAPKYNTIYSLVENGSRSMFLQTKARSGLYSCCHLLEKKVSRSLRANSKWNSLSFERLLISSPTLLFVLYFHLLWRLLK